MEKSNVIEHPGGSVTSIEKRKRKSYFLRIFARVPAVHYEDHREVHIVDILVVAYGGGGVFDCAIGKRMHFYTSVQCFLILCWLLFFFFSFFSLKAHMHGLLSIFMRTHRHVWNWRFVAYVTVITIEQLTFLESIIDASFSSKKLRSV